MARQIRGKECLKVLCLKRPTNAVSFLESFGLFSSFSSCFSLFLLCFSDCTRWVVMQLGSSVG
jgi:hypothetical protein